jgi:dimethylglycine dehydrogenase
MKHWPDDAAFTFRNRTANWGTLILTGPKSRDVLAQVCNADLSNDGFPWLSHQPVTIGMARGHALRVSYSGELGWEIHVPMEQLAGAYETIWRAGEPLGIRDFGIYALESLRLEKGYRSWKQDLSTDFTMLEGGLERFIAWDKADFIGKAALSAQKQQGPESGFAILLFDTRISAEAPYLSTIWKDNERVGLVTSAGYGYRIGRSVALGNLRADLIREGEHLEVEILGERQGARVILAPPYDPENARLKA